MKKIKKLFKKLNNTGSSMIMVIVALAFIGIIVGALLSAVGYSYRLKLQDLNSRDNFYYVEQAMNEIYAGVGSEVVGDMQEAYTYTVENMVSYDLETKTYVTKTKEEVQKSFEKTFMYNVYDNPLLNNNTIADTLESFISNDSVKLDRTKVYIQTERKDLDDPQRITKITIKNVVLTRTQDYDKNVASGSYVQTISTDIEIGEPDFDVLFNATTDDYANIFKYSMVADMGIEVHQPTVPLTVTGNVYAAADYYNKKYNESTYVVDADDNYTESDADKKFDSGVTYNVSVTLDDGTVTTEQKTFDYTHGSVTSKKYSGKSTLNNTYYNQYSTATFPAVAGSRDYYDGVLERSMYSGFFVDNSNVTVMADMMIVPGTVAVMNEGTLSLYGKNGSLTAESELWADNVVLGGDSDKKETTTAQGTEIEYTGSSAIFKANTYIKDDTELNSAGSTFSLNGSYYGYGDSTEKDKREFIPTVDSKNFQIEITDGTTTTTENRGHYNSSAIIINGQQSTLDLEQTDTIYLAGRSYIELSKDVASEEVVSTVTTTDDDGNEVTSTKTSVVETYSYLPETNNFVTADADDTVFLRDYKTGESISLKTNQLAYIPVMFKGVPEAVYYTNNVFAGYFDAELHLAVKDSELFEKYFPNIVFSYGDDKLVPCVMQEVSGKKYYYYDFETAYNKMENYHRARGTYAAFVATYPSAQHYAKDFIVDYVAELNDENSVIAEYLTDIGDFEELEFDAGDIILPDYELNPNVSIYSSGAITTKYDTEFDIISSDDWDAAALTSLLSSTKYSNGFSIADQTLPEDATTYGSAYQISNNLELEYDIVKWNLGHFDVGVSDQNVAMRNLKEIEYVQKLVGNADYGTASITPINKFLNMNEITPSTKIVPALSAGDAGTDVLDLDSGYSVWIGYDDVTVEARDGDGGIVRGIIVTKGDVFFDPDVKSFEGLIVSGGKVYITENLSKMYSSPAICQAVLRECQLLGTDNAKKVLNIFKGYEVDDNATSGGTGVATSTDSSEAKTIDSIDYSDVCRFSNWMKNVE